MPLRNPPSLVGKKFGALTVEARDGSILRYRAWRCRCICGNVVRASGKQLATGRASCGCRSKALIRQVAAEEERLWRGMLYRCYKEDHVSYKDYGGRGIRVCARWRDSFENFLSDMGPRPGPEYSIDRYPNMDGDYELSNCRWATAAEQARNTRYNVRVVIDGQTILLADYMVERGINPELIKKRLRIGWSIDDALSVPSGVPRAKNREPKKFVEAFFHHRKSSK